MTTEQILDYYQNNPDFKRYVDHWAMTIGEKPEVVAQYQISKLYLQQLLYKEENNHEEIQYELHQDNGI